jgi:hypothetical protein
MFSYFSLLVEQFFFDTIHVNFLIVGHTHSSIDQYFSVLTGSIKSALFIASPLSLMELLKKAHKVDAVSKRPAIVRQLVVYYDLYTALLPYVNKKIKVTQYVFYIFYIM